MAETLHIPREVIIAPLVVLGIIVLGYLALMGALIKTLEK
jgi:hypothetical protein